MDAPSRAMPRFAADQEEAAIRAINSVLEKWSANDQDVALAQAAAGGDILFLEACQRREIPWQITLPLPEQEFINLMILSSTRGQGWLKRYRALRDARPDAIKILPSDYQANEVTATPTDLCNLRLMKLAQGPEKLHFLCLWDGHSGEDPGGTGYMYRLATKEAACAEWIDTRLL